MRLQGAEGAVLSFSSTRPISYGQQVTIVAASDKAEKAFALAGSGLVDIRLDDVGALPEQSGATCYIVVRCSSMGTMYKHIALSCADFDRETDVIESRVLRILQR
ncbi:MAG: hypothetical protein ABR998_04630 [Gemmatimonadales bacterium]|jgi:hypothetical protein